MARLFTLQQMARQSTTLLHSALQWLSISPRVKAQVLSMHIMASLLFFRQASSPPVSEMLCLLFHQTEILFLKMSVKLPIFQCHCPKVWIIIIVVKGKHLNSEKSFKMAHLYYYFCHTKSFCSKREFYIYSKEDCINMLLKIFKITKD